MTGAVSLLSQDGAGQLWLGGILKVSFLSLFICIEIAEKVDAVCLACTLQEWKGGPSISCSRECYIYKIMYYSEGETILGFFKT